MISNIKADVDKKIVFGLFNPNKQVSVKSAYETARLVSSSFEVSATGGYMDTGPLTVKQDFMDYYKAHIATVTYPEHKYGLRPGNGENIVICYVSFYDEHKIRQRSIAFIWEEDSLIGVTDSFFNPSGIDISSSRRSITDIISDSISTLRVPDHLIADKAGLDGPGSSAYCHAIVTIPESGIRVVKMAKGKEEFNANLRKSVSRRLKGKAEVDEELIDRTFYESKSGCDIMHEIVLRDEYNHFVLLTLYYRDEKVLYAEIDYLSLNGD